MPEEKTLISEDNQQVKGKSKMVTESQLAWLAGMIDADGSISLFKANSAGKAPKICPCVNVANTNEHIIAEVLSILDGLGTSFHINDKIQYDKKHKVGMVVQTRNRYYIRTVLEAILPYLKGKDAQAKIVLRYVEKRIALAEKTGRTTYIPYDDKDWDDVATMKELNHRGPLPEPSTTIGASG